MQNVDVVLVDYLPPSMLRSSSYNNASMQDNDEYPHHAVALTLPRMLNASPQHHGLVQKLHIPFFYSWLPRFLQRLVSSVGFLGCDFAMLLRRAIAIA